jgi:hypothetical protein
VSDISDVHSYLIVAVRKNLAVESIIDILAPNRVNTANAVTPEIKTTIDFLLRNLPVCPV